MLPRVSHFAMLQDPGAFNRALLDFLAVTGG
jgi:pimeloyl-ACP methyl ester carboxylesterase